MDAKTIGMQILKYRKLKGMTQEELGQRVGVSTQAVSRWECGGAPDILLLPTIADVLSINVDMLFGRECGNEDTVQTQYIKYLSSLEDKQRLRKVIEFLNILEMESRSKDVSALITGVLPHAKMNGNENETIDSLFISDGGFMHGVCAQDFSFMGVFPEPDEGYASFFADNEFYRKLFFALSEPNVLEILTDLACEKDTLITPSAEAIRNNLSEEEAGRAMELLADAHIIDRTKLNQGRGVENVYSYSLERPIIPLLYYAIILGQKCPTHIMAISARTKPLLRKETDFKGENNI